MLLHFHKDKTDKLDLVCVANDFFLAWKEEKAYLETSNKFYNRLLRDSISITTHLVKLFVPVNICLIKCRRRLLTIGCQ